MPQKQLPFVYIAIRSAISPPHNTEEADVIQVNTMKKDPSLGGVFTAPLPRNLLRSGTAYGDVISRRNKAE